MINLKQTSILSLLLICSTFASAQNFRINGTVTGLPEGTWLYLRTASPEKILASTRIVHGNFNLNGKSTEKATRVILFTAKYTNYVTFWAENSIIMVLKNGEFKKGLIKGSTTQDEDRKLEQLKRPMDKKEDSLSNMLATTTDPTIKKDVQEKFRKTRKENQEFDMAYVKNNPNSLISANLLSIYSSTWGKEKTAALYEGLSIEMKNTSYGKNAKEFIALNKNIKIGDQYVDFEQFNNKGKKVKLSSIKGKYILLDFWASWCGPCREENPNLVKTYIAFKDKGFNILGVSADDNKNYWLKAIKDDQLLWENVSDLKGDRNRAALIYGINAYPTNFLIDEHGKIIAKNLRGAALDKKLKELLP